MVETNVDTPTRKLTIHLSQNRWVRARRTTRWKGVGHLLRDGGWLPYPSLANAVAAAQARWPNYRVTVCP